MRKGIYLTYSIIITVLLLTAGLEKSYAGECSLAITTTSLPSAKTGDMMYFGNIQTTGASDVVQLTVTSGSLPPGLSIDGIEEIYGSPTTAGTYNFTVQADDGNCTATKDLSIIINPCGLEITTDTLPNTTVGVFIYNGFLQTTGGNNGGIVQYSVSAGSLPPGLSIGGMTGIQGMPTTAGTYNFTVKATDGQYCSTTKDFKITVAPCITINTDSLPNAPTDVSYSQAIQYTWSGFGLTTSISSGALPPGLNISPFNATISGTPTTVGNYDFTVQFSGGGGCSGSKSYSIDVFSPCNLSVTTTSLPDATAGVPYSQTVVQTGGTGSVTFAMTAGSLMPGLTLTPNGTISGTPTVTGESNFSVTATDSNSCTATAPLNMNINCPTGGATLNLPTSTICSNAEPVQLSGGSPSEGTYSGTGVNENMFDPTAGTQQITYFVTDIYSCVQQASATMTVTSAPEVSLDDFTPVCSNTATITLTGGMPEGGTYSGTGVTEGQFSTSYVGPQTITYTYTANNCTAQATNTLMVNSTPDVGLAVQQTLCSNSDPITLEGGVPEGGTYYGVGVKTGQFSPTAGTQTVNYTYTNTNNCTAVASRVIVVNGAPDVDQTDFTPVCNNAGAITLTGGTPTGGVYSGSGVTDNTFDPSAGTQTVTYTYSDGNECAAQVSKPITVNTATPVTLGNFTPVCSNNQPVTLTRGTPDGGYYSGTGVSQGLYFDPLAGTQTITYSYTDNNTCTSTDSKTITVNQSPDVTLEAFITTCGSAGPVTLTGGSPTGGMYAGTGVTNGTFNPEVGSQNITYEYTDESTNCSGTATQALTVSVCAGINEIATDAITCYPNPAMNVVTVKITQALQGNLSAHLVDITGQVLAKDEYTNWQGAYEKSFDLSHFAPGMYMIEIRNGDTLTTKKIVKD